MSESKNLCPRCGEPMELKPGVRFPDYYICRNSESACAKIAELKRQLCEMDETFIDICEQTITHLGFEAVLEKAFARQSARSNPNPKDEVK